MGLGPLGEHVACGRIRILWDSGTTGAGAAIDSPAIDCRYVRSLGVFVDNSAGAGTDALTADILLEDGVTAFLAGLAVRVVAIGAKETGTIGPDNAATASTPAIQFALPIPVPPWLKLHLASLAAARRITVWASA